MTGENIGAFENYPIQPSMFEELDVPVVPSDLGYRGPTACAAAGITYRQLD